MVWFLIAKPLHKEIEFDKFVSSSACKNIELCGYDDFLFWYCGYDNFLFYFYFCALLCVVNMIICDFILFLCLALCGNFVYTDLMHASRQLWISWTLGHLNEKGIMSIVSYTFFFQCLLRFICWSKRETVRPLDNEYTLFYNVMVLFSLPLLKFPQ